ncbi:hypothetical protein, partial [Mycobacterium tuberculosis]|uniref:hypothetical protein n=1 Tax=Mycobacterium tuberculosis TaxID=1773 RepID=UPI001AE1D782
MFVDEIIQASFLIVDILAIAASAALVDTLVPYDGEGLGDLARLSLVTAVIVVGIVLLRGGYRLDALFSMRAR